MRLLVALAVIPGIVVLMYVYKKDRIEKEPTRLLLKLFFLGALSIIPSIIFEYLASYLIYESFDTPENATTFQIFIENFLGVGLVEEFFKYVMLKKGSWKNENFNYRFDAIVYAVCVSMGFAVVENISYVTSYGIGNAITRALLSIPGHACFAICMGIYYGQAKLFEKYGGIRKCKRNLRLAVIMPMLMHGFFDFSLSVDSYVLYYSFFAYAIIVDIICLKKVKKYSEQDVLL